MTTPPDRRLPAPPPDPVPVHRLHDDATHVLEGWHPADGRQAALRRRFVAHLARHPDALWRSCHPDHVTASGLVVDAAGGRVLLTLHSRLGRWLQTGGHCEPGDRSLASAALREAVEESGVGGLVVDPAPLRLDRHRVPCGPLRPAHHLDVQYLALAPAGARERRSEESAELTWFAVDVLPDGADDSVRALVADARSRLAQSVSVRAPAASETPSR